MTTSSWTDAASLSDVPSDAGLGVGVAGRDIALFRVGESVYAIDNLCTHDFATLCDGFLEGHEIECPLHQARFDLRTGAATCAPAVDAVKTYPVRIEGGRVLLAID
jgi:naphthalene 1,2-dioxygenase system ferredoxin subunit